MDCNITYRKKDKGWQYIITTKEGKEWKYKGSKQGFITKAAAKVAADAHVDEMKDKEEIQQEALPEHKELTLKELSEIYKKHKTLHRAYNTVKSFSYAISYFSTLNDKTVRDITSLDIQTCVDEMTRAGLMESSIELYLRVVKTFFKFAIKPYKIIRENPVQDIVVSSPQDGSGNKKIKALNKAELEDLLFKIKMSSPKYYIASLLAGKCGLRIGEIVGLTWDRVDTKVGIITINRQWKEIQEKKWGFGPPKSENSYRDIPAPPIVISELMKFKSRYPVHISGRILPYSTSLSLANALFSYYPTKGYNISVHDLRHTYATMLIANGLDFKTVAQLMGHDVEETIRTYSHVTSDMIANATNLINQIF
jgi:integrase